MSWWRTEVNRLREENEAVKNLASALHERLWEVESERDEWQDRYRDLQSEYARRSQARSEQHAYYEDRLARAEHRRAAAVARADQLRDERDDALTAGLEALRDAERDGDGAVARAEVAEARLADPYSQTNQDAAAWDRVAAHPALRMSLLPDVEGSYADCVFERITWLAEVAEAVTEMKPAVAADRAEAHEEFDVWLDEFRGEFYDGFSDGYRSGYRDGRADE